MEIRHALMAGVVSGALVACGGSGSDSDSDKNSSPSYSGKQEAAVLSSENSSDLAKTAKQAIKSAEAKDQRNQIPMAGLSASSSRSISRSIQQSQILSGDCGGSMTISGSEIVSLNFDQYCDDDVIIDGSMLMKSSSSGNTTTTLLTYNQVSIRVDGQNIVTNGTLSTVDNPQTGISRTDMNMTVNIDGEVMRLVESIRCKAHYQCTTTTTYSVDGETFQAENLQFSSDDSGSQMSARIYDEDEGYFEMSAQNITYCDNGNIKMGTIRLTDDDTNQVDISFDGDCENMTVTMDGVANTVAQ